MTQDTYRTTNLPPTIQRTLDLVHDDPRTQEDLCADAGTDRRTLYGWRRRGAASLSTLEAVLGAMGYRLEIVPIKKVRGPES